MTRPRAPKDSPVGPDPETVGGGGTIRGAPPPTPEDRDPATARCSATESCGAGAITELRPMFRSPSGRVDAISTLGGGATTAGCRAWKEAAFEPLTSGGGATTEVCSVGEFRRCVRWAASGGGVTIEFSNCGAIRVMSAAGVSGTGGIASRGFSILSDIFSDQATMLGSATSRCSLTLGGATMVCERLSASGGTEMMGCRENSGSALTGCAASALRVSSGGRYSDGW